MGEEAPAKKATGRGRPAGKAKKAAVYKEDSEEDGNASDSEFEVVEDEGSEDDFDPKASAKKTKKTPAKKKSGGKGGKKGRGRPPGPAAAKKKESSPIYYEYDLSDTSFESEEGSDDSGDSNYRPNAPNTRVKKRKTVAEAGWSSDDDNWRPGKDFPGQPKKSKATKKIKATKVTVGAPGEKRGRGRPAKGEGKVEKRGRPKKQKAEEEENGSEEEEKKEEEEEEKASGAEEKDEEEDAKEDEN